MTAPEFRTVSTGQLIVDPVNPRPEPGDVDELAASIDDIGIVNPLIVRPRQPDGIYGVLSGQRRLAAALKLGLDDVPCLIHQPATDADALAIATAENVGRKAMDPITEARTFRRLLDELGCDQYALADRLGISQATLSKRLQLLSLPDDLQDQVANGELSVHNAYMRARTPRSPRKRTGTPAAARRNARTPDHVNGTGPVAQLAPPTRWERPGYRHVEISAALLEDVIAAAARDGMPPNMWIADTLRRRCNR